MEFDQIRHFTDVTYGFYGAVHTDAEWVCGACVFQAGVRIEYSANFCDVLQPQNGSDIQDVLLLFSAGVRF